MGLGFLGAATFLKARSAPSSVSSASALCDASRKRLYCAGSSGLRCILMLTSASAKRVVSSGRCTSGDIPTFFYSQLLTAIAAIVYVKSRSLNTLIEERFSPYLVAICTYVMRGFNVTGCGLYRISYYIWGESHQFIPIFFCLPCFKISHALFKSAYF